MLQYEIGPFQTCPFMTPLAPTWLSGGLCLQGQRIFVASDAAAPPRGRSAFADSAEGWAAVDAALDQPRRAHQLGASRTALAPFLALKVLGETFRWAFVGTPDAQTAFFPAAAVHITAGLDANVPYFLTGVLLHNLLRNTH